MSATASTDGEPALRVRDVAKRFGSAVALDRASLELRRGERLALLGPNGAGKTTLVRCSCGRAGAGPRELVAEVGDVALELATLGSGAGRRGLRPGQGNYARLLGTHCRTS